MGTSASRVLLTGTDCPHLWRVLRVLNALNWPECVPGASFCAPRPIIGSLSEQRLYIGEHSSELFELNQIISYVPGIGSSGPGGADPFQLS